MSEVKTGNNPKTIEEKWQDFRQILLRGNIPPEGIAACRVSFWSGAAAMASLLPLGASREDLAAALTGFLDEFEQFRTS
jgi:hypothetical protein